MCELISAITATVTALTAVASTAVSVASTIQTNNATQAQYNYQAELDKRNAKIAQNNAQNTRQEGIEQARLQRIKTLQSIGSQQTSMAANGIDISQGTALDIVEDTAQMGELEANTIKYKYDTLAQNYENQSSNYTQQSSVDTIQSSVKSNELLARTLNTGMNGLSTSMNSIKTK